MCIDEECMRVFILWYFVGKSLSNQNYICAVWYHRGTARAYGNARYGQGAGPIAINNVRCIGTEARIGLCNFAVGAGTCDHSHDAGVACNGGEAELGF